MLKGFACRTAVIGLSNVCFYTVTKSEKSNAAPPTGGGGCPPQQFGYEPPAFFSFPRPPIPHRPESTKVRWGGEATNPGLPEVFFFAGGGRTFGRGCSSASVRAATGWGRGEAVDENAISQAKDRGEAGKGADTGDSRVRPAFPWGPVWLNLARAGGIWGWGGGW